MMCFVLLNVGWLVINGMCCMCGFFLLSIGFLLLKIVFAFILLTFIKIRFAFCRGRRV